MKTPQVIVQIDHQEGLPWSIDAFPFEVVQLPVGDYGIKEFSDWNNPAFIVERKSLDDFISSFSWNEEAEIRKVEKMRAFRFACYIVEGTREQIVTGAYASKTTPASLLARIDALLVRCGISVIFGGTPEESTRRFYGLVHQFLKGLDKDTRRLKRACIPSPPEKIKKGRWEEK